MKNAGESIFDKDFSFGSNFVVNKPETHGDVRNPKI